MAFQESFKVKFPISTVCELSSQSFFPDRNLALKHQKRKEICLRNVKVQQQCGRGVLKDKLQSFDDQTEQLFLFLISLLIYS